MTFPTINLNRDFYIQILDHGSLGVAFTETDLEFCSKAQALDDLITRQNDNVIQVIKLNLQTHQCEDASAHLADLWWQAISYETIRDRSEVPEFIKTHHPAMDAIDQLFNVAEVAQ
jgi:hypothetical protein